MADTKELVRRDIAEAFEFARFIIKHPKVLGKIKDGSEIQFVPNAVRRAERPARPAGKIQAFSTETIFHRL